MAWILECLADRNRQTSRLHQDPEQDMGIEENSHSPPFEQPKNFLGKGRIEIRRNRAPAFEEAESASGRHSIDADQSRHRATGTGDHDVFTRLHGRQQLRESGLGFVDVDSGHGSALDRDLANSS